MVCQHFLNAETHFVFRILSRVVMSYSSTVLSYHRTVHKVQLRLYCSTYAILLIDTEYEYYKFFALRTVDVNVGVKSENRTYKYTFRMIVSVSL